ncbi:MAG: glycosyltransferase [Suipraeoptans sp.]
MPKKKLLIAMPELGGGGAEKSLVNLLNEMDEKRYEIDLLLFKKRGSFKHLYLYLLKIIGTACSNIVTGKTRYRKPLRWKYFYRFGIGKLEKEYDIAVAFLSGEIMYFVSEKVDADIKHAWIHNDYVAAGHPEKYDYKHLRCMDKIITISDKCLSILQTKFPEFIDKCIMLPNIVSPTHIRNLANEYIPKEYNRQTSTILSIGRLSRQKGYDLAIQAAAVLIEQKIDFCWYVIGEGELESELKHQIKQAHLEENFKLLGIRENPYPYIKHCDILVQSSRYEGKSLVLDEAKILAAPIISTKYPTVGDQITDGVEGLIAEMNYISIADKIKN